MGRTVGRSLREFRRAAYELRSEVQSDLDDEPPVVPSPAARKRRAAKKAEPQTEPTPPTGEAPPT